jgi:DGQHR domain-containing protein
MTTPSAETPWEVRIPCVRVQQPLGTFFVASIEAKVLTLITRADVRRMVGERPFETYLGIQRPLNAKRVEDIATYVNTRDACFPTAVILAIESRCAIFDEQTSTLTLKNYVPEKDAADEQPVYAIQIARVLDGQHRIEGLKDFRGDIFDVNVSIFIDADIEDQAYLFSTVNLTQTKVNKSLVYDLLDLARTRSPQKTCHNIAVGLDQGKGSPFERKIKRLGSATPGRTGETLTQATVVESLLQYISEDPIVDRDLYLRGKTPAKVTGTTE